MQDLPVCDPACHRFHQWSVRNLIEIATQVHIDHRRVPGVDQAVHGFDRVQRTYARAVRVLLQLQVGFEDWLKHQHHRRLHNPLAYRCDPQWSFLLAVWLRNEDPSDRLRPVRLVPELATMYAKKPSASGGSAQDRRRVRRCAESRKDVNEKEVRPFWQHGNRHRSRGSLAGRHRGRPSGGRWHR